jgi:hypothetical protein
MKSFLNGIKADLIGRAAGSVPSAPTAGNIVSFARAIGGRILPWFRAPSGEATPLQPLMVRKTIYRAVSHANSTTITTEGASLTLLPTTAVAASLSSVNKFQSTKRSEILVGTAALGAVSGWRTGTAVHWRGNAAGLGGFHIICRWGPATGVSVTTSRAFVGLGSTAAPTDVEPSTQTQIVGMGWDAADTNIQMMVNAGLATATKVDLGASFPVPIVDRTAMYEIALFCEPNGATITYEVTDLVSGAVATGTLSTNLPTNTTFMAYKGWMSNGGATSVIGVALLGYYGEADY